MEYKTLNEIATNFRYGRMPDKSKLTDSGIYPVWSGYRYVGYYNEKNINKEEIVVVARGVGGTGDVKICKEDCFLTNLSIAFNVNEDINPLYVYYYYQIKNLRYLDSGSAQSQITINDLKNVKIPVPNKIIQDKIVEVLNKLDQKIELNNEINNNLQELINKTFIEYFVNYNIDNVKLEFVESDIGLIPKGWSIGILSDIVEFSNGYGFDSKKMLDKNENETFSVFKMGNINIGGGINKSKTKSWMKKEDCEGLDKFIAKKGDILMCMTDMKNSGNPLLGHTALIDKDNEFVINQRVGILRCTKGISYEYVYTLSNLDFFISDLRSRANSGVQVNLTTTGICNTQILIPDKDCIDKFNKIAKPLYEKKFNVMQQNETLEQLRDTLLPKLMNGEIDLDNIEI